MPPARPNGRAVRAVVYVRTIIISPVYIVFLKIVPNLRNAILNCNQVNVCNVPLRFRNQSAIGLFIAEEIAEGFQSRNMQKYDCNDAHNGDGQNHADDTP
jgi:hypothetical protein